MTDKEIKMILFLLGMSLISLVSYSLFGWRGPVGFLGLLFFYVGVK